MDEETGVDAIEAAIKEADEKADELQKALLHLHQVWNSERAKMQRLYEVLDDAAAAK